MTISFDENDEDFEDSEKESEDSDEDGCYSPPNFGSFNPCGCYPYPRYEQPNITSKLLDALIVAHEREIANLKASHARESELFQMVLALAQRKG